MQIIDTHIHYGVNPDTPNLSADFERVLEVTRAAGTTAHLFLATWDQLVPAPVTPERILRGNEQMLRDVGGQPDCWMMACFNPEMPQVVSQVEQLLGEDKCLGIKCGPAYHRYDMAGPAGRAVFEFIVAHDTPAVFHTCPDEYDHPQRILPLTDEFPQARVLLAHFATLSPPTLHSQLVSQHCSPNVWLGFDHPTCINYGLLETCVGIVGADRIIYGSDMPCYYARPMIEGVLSPRLSDADKQSILAANAERFLGRSLGR